MLAVAAAWPVLPAQSASARGTGAGPADGNAAPKLILVEAGNFCAAYGAGFVQLQGTNTCVRIGGHVRVDSTLDGSEQFEWGTGSFSAAPGNTQSAPSHVRLDGNFDAPSFR